MRGKGLVLSLFFTSLAAQGAPQGANLFAYAIRVEGKGIPKLRKVTGTETVAGEKSELHPGDRLITDDQSSIEFTLPEGTILRLGSSSEFRLDSVVPGGGNAWTFSLTRGSARILVESSSPPASTPTARQLPKLRLKTPSAQLSSSGGDVLIDVDGEKKETRAIVFHGQFQVGALGCEAKKNCSVVSGGQKTIVGGKAAAKVDSFQTREIYQLPDPKEDKKADLKKLDARLLLFRTVRVNSADVIAQMTDQELDVLTRDAREQLQGVQDRYLGLDAPARDEMLRALQEKTFSRYELLAEAYFHLRGVTWGNPITRAYPIGPVNARKFAMGRVVLRSGVFAKGEEAKAEKWAKAILNTPPPELPAKPLRGPAPRPNYTAAVYGAQIGIIRALMAVPVVDEQFQILEEYFEGFGRYEESCSHDFFCTQQYAQYKPEKLYKAVERRGPTPRASTPVAVPGKPAAAPATGVTTTSHTTTTTTTVTPAAPVRH